MRYTTLLITLGVLLTGCVDSGQPPQSFEELVKRLDETEKAIRAHQQNMRETIQKYNDSHPEGARIDTASIDLMALDDQQVATIERMLGSEEDVSYRGLLKQLMDTHGQVQELQNQLRDYQARLPAPYTVQRNDTHEKVAMRFLMENHGLSQAEAMDVIEKTAMVDELHPGFQVWMHYQDATLATYVTQGTANISPGRAQRYAKQQIRTVIETLTANLDVAEENLDSLMMLQAELETQLSATRDEESRLEEEIARLNEARDETQARIALSEQKLVELESQVNSVFYDVNTMDAWKKSKVIKDPLFGGPEVESLSGVAFSQAQDLRQTDTLTFEADAFPPLKRIKKVDVFPRTFKEGEEYLVALEDEGSRVRITILKPALFAGQNVIVALR